MISVFFRCACPYVGYTLKRADYTNHEMHDCLPGQMTRTGHKLLHSSGSYLVLGRFEGKKYFHIRQSKSTALDEQGRQIYTNLALVGSTKEDERTINRIAGYALLDEDRFYREIASMMILLDGDFTVNFEALREFLARFDRDYQVETSDPRLKTFCKEILFAETKNEIDFIVAEADWNYFVKQVGINFRMPPYWFTYQEAKSMAKSAKLVFAEATGDRDALKIEAVQKTETVQKAEPVRRMEEKETTVLPDRSQEQGRQEADKLNEQLQSLQQTHELMVREKQMLEKKGGNLQQQLEATERKLVEMGTQLQQLTEKIKKSFFLGLLVGLIGMALAILIFGQIRGCTKGKSDVTEPRAAAVATQITNIERGSRYA